jgi:5-methylcytosine-specific restriction protein A
MSNNEPLKPRERAGGHSEVYEAPEWFNVEVMGMQEYQEKSDEEFKHAMNLPFDILERRANERLDAKRKPQTIFIRQQGFIRDGYVRAATLKRANGKCERCKRDSPFISKSTGLPYLEVHHKIMLANDGEDTLENTIALCPNCHRYLHFGV